MLCVTHFVSVWQHSEKLCQYELHCYEMGPPLFPKLTQSSFLPVTELKAKYFKSEGQSIFILSVRPSTACKNMSHACYPNRAAFVTYNVC